MYSSWPNLESKTGPSFFKFLELFVDNYTSFKKYRSYFECFINEDNKVTHFKKKQFDLLKMNQNKQFTYAFVRLYFSFLQD